MRAHGDLPEALCSGEHQLGSYGAWFPSLTGWGLGESCSLAQSLFPWSPALRHLHVPSRSGS